VLIGENEYCVGTGWAVVCLPSSRHCLSTKSSEWEYRWITVDGSYALALLSTFQIPKIPFAVKECPEKTFRDLENALKNPSPNGERLASGKAYEFIVQISCQTSVKRESASTRILATLLSEIENEITNPDLNVNFLSEQTEISRFTIHRIFRDEFGMPPKNYIDSLRLQKILSLLRETDLTIATIAANSGLTNANYLSKFFRKKMHCTPTQFRDAKHMP